MPISVRGRTLAALAALAIATAGCGASTTPSPAPTPTPTVAPTPTPVDVGAVFLEQLTGAQAGSLPVTGTASFGGVEAAITGAFESSGADDSASTMTFDVAGSKQVSESIRIGTQKWSRDNGGVWILDPKPADSTKSLMAYLKTLTTLDDKGVETKDGRELHHLVAPAGAELTAETMGLDPSIQDADIQVDFWAEEDGTPAVMSIAVAWSQASGATTVPVEMAMDVDLAGFGTPVTIEAPADAWTGFTSTRFGYSMAYADGWSVSEEDGLDVYSLDGQPYVYVSPQDVPADYTLERFHEELLAYYKAKDIVAEPTADEDYVLDGSPARALTYLATNAAGTDIFVVDVISVHDGTGWEVYLAQGQVDMEESRSFFDTMVSTFSFEG